MSVPIDNDGVVHVATSTEDNGTTPHSFISEPLERNSTFPVGNGGPPGVIDAVRVTIWPAVDDFVLEVTVVFDGIRMQLKPPCAQTTDRVKVAKLAVWPR